MRSSPSRGAWLANSRRCPRESWEIRRRQIPNGAACHDEDPYGSADPAPLPAGAGLVPNVGSAMSLHNGPVVMQLRRWNYSQGICRRSPASNTGDRMPPVTPTPGESEAPLTGGILSDPSRLGDDHPNRNVLHCIRPRRQIVFRQVFRHTPGNAFWSGGGGGMTKREHTLKACSCDGARWRSWKGALKAPTYLLAPVRLSSARGKDPTERRLHASF